jgi:hypothetical protein
VAVGFSSLGYGPILLFLNEALSKSLFSTLHGNKQTLTVLELKRKGRVGSLIVVD